MSTATTSKTRPTGVTIIAILNVISGVVMLAAGLGLAAISSILPTMGTLEPNASGQLAATGVVGIAVGGILIVLGIISFIVAWGLLKGKGWAWGVTMVLSIISIVTGVISMVAGSFGSIVNIIIAGIIMYYLYKPHVRAFFGKSPKALV